MKDKYFRPTNLNELHERLKWLNEAIEQKNEEDISNLSFSCLNFSDLQEPLRNNDYNLILETLPRLKEIKCTNNQYMNDSWLKDIANNCSQLNTLTLESCHNITSLAGLEKLKRTLTKLAVSGCKNLTPKAFKVLIKLQLENLNCAKTAIASLECLENSINTLKHLSVSGCNSLKPKDFNSLKGFELVAFHCENTAVNSLTWIKGAEKTLRKFMVSGCDALEPKHFKALEDFQLRSLYCNNTNITLLKYLEGSKKTLKHLSVSGCKKLNVEQFIYLQQYRQLIWLDCLNTNIDSATVNRLKITLGSQFNIKHPAFEQNDEKISDVESLDSYYIPDSLDELRKRLNENKALLTHINILDFSNLQEPLRNNDYNLILETLLRLKEIRCTNNQYMNNSWLKDIANNCSQLNALWLKSCHNITSLAGLEKLKGTLTTLAVPDCKNLSPKAFEVLIKFQLEHLMCEESKIYSLECLKNSINTLKVLDVHGCSNLKPNALKDLQGFELEKLYCAATPIDSLAGLEDSKESLKVLNVNHCSNLSDQEFIRLLDYQQLTELVCHHTKITLGVVNTLTAALGEQCTIDSPHTKERITALEKRQLEKLRQLAEEKRQLEKQRQLAEEKRQLEKQNQLAEKERRREGREKKKKITKRIKELKEKQQQLQQTVNHYSSSIQRLTDLINELMQNTCFRLQPLNCFLTKENLTRCS